MPVTKYFGRKTLEFGRPLWEIVLNLKNFGKGRYILRSIVADKYPKEPCFYKILSVHPHIIEYPDTFQGNIFVQEVHRGIAREGPVDIGDIAETAGFRLILKEDEEILLKKWEQYKTNPLPVNVLPRTAPLPPLWRDIIAREKGIRSEDVPEIPLIHDAIEAGVGAPRRIAAEGEQPTFRIGPGNWKPKYPQLLQHVVWPKENAREKFCKEKPEPDFIYADKKLEPVEISSLVTEKSEQRVKSNS